MAKFSKELVGATSIPIILSILSTKESYGYEIIQSVKKISNGQIEYGDGTIYPVLHKMEKKGLIESFWKVSENGRKRKYYKVVEPGIELLKLEKENWLIVNQIISKLWKIEPNLT